MLICRVLTVPGHIARGLSCCHQRWGIRLLFIGLGRIRPDCNRPGNTRDMTQFDAHHHRFTLSLSPDLGGSAATAPWHMWNEASIVVRRNGFPRRARRASNPGLAECILVEKQTLRPIRPRVWSSSVYGPVTATVDSKSECLMEAVSLLRLRTPESILAASPRKRLVSSQVAGVERPPADRNPANSPQSRQTCQNDSSVSPAPARPVLASGNLARRRSSTAAQLPVVTAAACYSLRRGVLQADFSPALPFLLEQSRCSGRSDY